MIPKIRLTQWASCAGCAAKMDANTLGEVLHRLPPAIDPNLLVGLKTGDDAGVYRIAPDLALVNTVDFFPPIVDDPYDFGRIAAANALSDVYAMGARPLTAMNLVTFPKEGLALEVLHEILRGGSDKLAEAGVALVGGHSVTDPEPKYGLAVTGLVDPARVVTNAGAQPGDVLVLTKPIGVGIITTALKQGVADAHTVAQAVESMAQLNRRAAELMVEGGAHACTDITGYGLLGHAVEMATASAASLHIEYRAVPYFTAALELLSQGIAPGGLAANRRAFNGKIWFGDAVPGAWRELLFDPQTSGGLLVALPEAGAGRLVERLAADGFGDAAVIGRIERRESDTLITVA
ncbi:MAG: selenide, water dikinase SelD [Candidatus Muproteobacteria bacterium RBG_16_64_11]|uniref:Selenide, water dikinase n=1 Tax=Candidatus Muproteobacteria bacterium RBG_16_64_11 TaxID=1817758 RepID=A0A1F6TIS0_9PROT|nr:MAG: selenide, water dikinase SelD [Candidatus Muproteobacteria bacterium RBG_16_64_11]